MCGFVHTVADRVLFPSEGRILEQDDPDAVLVHSWEDATWNFPRGHGAFRLLEPQLD